MVSVPETCIDDILSVKYQWRRLTAKSQSTICDVELCSAIELAAAISDEEHRN